MEYFIFALIFFKRSLWKNNIQPFKQIDAPISSLARFSVCRNFLCRLSALALIFRVLICPIRNSINFQLKFYFVLILPQFLAESHKFYESKSVSLFFNKFNGSPKNISLMCICAEIYLFN